MRTHAVGPARTPILSCISYGSTARGAAYAIHTSLKQSPTRPAFLIPSARTHAGLSHGGRRSRARRHGSAPSVSSLAGNATTFVLLLLAATSTSFPNIFIFVAGRAGTVRTLKIPRPGTFVFPFDEGRATAVRFENEVGLRSALDWFFRNWEQSPVETTIPRVKQFLRNVVTELERRAADATKTQEPTPKPEQPVGAF